MKKQKLIRQGDVLLVPVNSIPVSADKDACENGRAILAHGEVTGHMHLLEDELEAENIQYRMTPEGQRFVSLIKETALRHEEHAAVMVVEGKYRQAFQVEDFGEEVRRVED